LAHSWPILLYGKQAARSLSTGQRLQVLAVFNHSCYVTSSKQDNPQEAIVCLLDKTYPAGPLHVLCQMPSGFLWADHFTPGMSGYVTTAGLLLGSHYWFPARQVPVWQAEPISCPDRAVLRAGLARLRQLIETEFTPPAEGLSVLLKPILEGKLAKITPTAPLVATALPAILALQTGLQKPDRAFYDDTVLSRIAELIGLGPGLTPSGDDILAGVLFGLKTLGQQAIASPLAQYLLAAVGDRTNTISLAYLHCAAAGEATAPLDDFLRALCRNDITLASALTAVSRIGHSSGWDSLTGLVLACQAVTQQRSEAQRNIPMSCSTTDDF
jgi:hypothetical protein